MTQPLQRIRAKRVATAAQWTAANTLLLCGEVGRESDTGLEKTGTGDPVTGLGGARWNDLGYDSTGGSGADQVARDAAAAAQDTANAKASLQTGPLVASTTAAPNATAVQNAIAAAAGGNTPVQRVTSTPTPPLDLAGNGKAMPYIFGDRIPVNGAVTLFAPLFSAMVDGGICRASYRVNVGGSVDDSAFIRGGLAMDAGYDYEVLFIAGLKPLMSVVRGDAIPAVDTTAPLIGTPAIADGARGFIDTPISELNTPSLNGVLGGVTLTGFGGKTATAVAVVGSVLRVTLSANAAYGESGTIAFAAGMVKDPSNNLSVAKAATAVTNNVGLPLPGADTIAPGATTSSSQVIDVSAAGTNAATRKWQYKLASDGVWIDSATDALTTHTFPGLTASTSYTFRTQTINATGPSATYSNIVTQSTSAGASPSTITITRQAVAEADGTDAETFWSRYYENNGYGAGTAFGPTAASADVFNFTNMVDPAGSGSVLSAEITQQTYGFAAVNQGSVQRALSHVAATALGGRVRIWLTTQGAYSSSEDTAHKPRIVASFADGSESQFSEIDLSVYGGGGSGHSHVYDIVFDPASPTVLNFGYEDPAPGLYGFAMHAMAYFPNV